MQSEVQEKSAELIASLEYELEREYRHRIAMQAYRERWRRRPRQRAIPPIVWVGIACVLFAAVRAFMELYWH